MVIAVETSEHISWSSQNMISNQWFIMITFMVHTDYKRVYLFTGLEYWTDWNTGLHVFGFHTHFG